MNQFLKEFFKFVGTMILRYSFGYHMEKDGQLEMVNQTLKLIKGLSSILAPFSTLQPAKSS